MERSSYMMWMWAFFHEKKGVKPADCRRNKAFKIMDRNS